MTIELIWPKLYGPTGTRRNLPSALVCIQLPLGVAFHLAHQRINHKEIWNVTRFESFIDKSGSCVLFKNCTNEIPHFKIENTPYFRFWLSRKETDLIHKELCWIWSKTKTFRITVIIKCISQIKFKTLTEDCTWIITWVCKPLLSTVDGSIHITVLPKLGLSFSYEHEITTEYFRC